MSSSTLTKTKKRSKSWELHGENHSYFVEIGNVTRTIFENGETFENAGNQMQFFS